MPSLYTRPKPLFHGSEFPLDLGTLLECRRRNHMDSELEELLERHRPRACPSRAFSIFMADDIKAIEHLCLNHDYVYRVAPTGPCWRFDHAWANRAYKILVAQESGCSHPVARNLLAAHAREYWSGRQSNFGRFEPPLWEVLSPGAMILSEVDLKTGRDVPVRREAPATAMAPNWPAEEEDDFPSP